MKVKNFKPITSVGQIIEKQEIKIYGKGRFYAMMHGYSARRYFESMGVKICTKNAVSREKNRVLGKNNIYGG